MHWWKEDGKIKKKGQVKTDLTKYVPDYESNRNLWSVFKAEGRATNPSSKEQLKRIICKEQRNIFPQDLVSVIHAQEDWIVHPK